MARQGISVDFDGIFELEKTLSNMGAEVFEKAVINALTASKNYVNKEIAEAMDASSYNFDGTGYSRLKSKKGLSKVEQMDVEIRGTEAVAYAGVSFNEAPELWFIAHGAPNTPKDPKIYNAVRVKGNVKKEVERIQREEFDKVIQEALTND